MNCKGCQRKILDSLAAGFATLAPEIAAHQNSCPACAEFYQAHQKLFHSIDAALQSFANQPAPPYLLPTIRARLGAASSPNWAIPAWIPVAALVLLAFLLSAPFLLRIGPTSVARVALRSPQPQTQSVRPQSATVVSNVLLVPAFRKNERALGKHHRAFQLPAQADRLQFLPLGDEARALAALAAAVQRWPDWGDALAHPVQLPSANTGAIPAIEVARLEVAPLTDETW